MIHLSRLFFTYLTFVSSVNAANWVVDNDQSNNAANFHDIQAAVDASNDGDTIYVMPSLNRYADITLDKGLVLVGAGFGASEVFGPENTERSSSLNDVTIPAGVSNLFITGFHIRGMIEFPGGDSSDDQDELRNEHIYISRNYFDDDSSEQKSVFVTGSYHYIDKTYLINNYFWDKLDIAGPTDPRGDTRLKFTIHGNIIRDTVDAYDVFSLTAITYYSGTWVDMRNNVCTDEAKLYLRHGIFADNVVIDNEVATDKFGVFASAPGQDLVVYNNCFVDDLLDSEVSTDNGNFLATESDIFTQTGSWGLYYEPAQGSPLLGAGMDGGDIGIFDGNFPWDLDQQPPLPIIKKLTGPSVAGPGQPLTLSVEIESNK